MTEKPLSQLMKDESDRLDAEDVEEAAVADTEQAIADGDTEAPYKPTMGELEQYLIDEGQWLEGQLAVETAHKNCPMCAMLPEVFQALTGAMEEALEQLDALKESGLEDSFVIELLLRNKAWYECAKGIALQLFEQGHRPRNVINAHPELRGLAFQKRAQQRRPKKKSRRARRRR